MHKKNKPCPHCGHLIACYKNPVPTVDVIIETPEGGVVLIHRNNPPYGWALPGGFVDYGETVEQAAVREAKEETNLEVQLTGLLGVYSGPDRDPRQHTLSVTFIAEAEDLDTLAAGDDAGRIGIFPCGQWPEMAFDHLKILTDYGQGKKKRA